MMWYIITINFNCIFSIAYFYILGGIFYRFYKTFLTLSIHHPTTPVTSTKLYAEGFLCEISCTLQNKHCIALLWYHTSTEKEMLRDSVQRKCHLSYLSLMRQHLWQEGRKLLLWKTHKKTLMCCFWELTRKCSKGSNYFTSHTYACLR